MASAVVPAGEAYCFNQVSRGLESLVDSGAGAIVIDPIAKDGSAAWLTSQAGPVKAWATATGFKGKDGEVCIVPSADGGIDRVAFVLEDAADVWAYAALPGKLPAGTYTRGAGANADAAALGWVLGAYSFDRYKTAKANGGAGWGPLAAGCDLPHTAGNC
jgi:leucyl aminopeptidase